MTQLQFIKALQDKGYSLTDTQIQQFEQYRSFLQQENKKINLTALISDEDIYEKHFYDCCLILPLLKDVTSFCDVGSGAGFPGVVIAIMRNDIEVTLVEPTQKRCHFLSKLIELCELDNVSVINKRSEDYTEGFEMFDVVSARAVANLSILLEICLPLLKIEGTMIAMKGALGQEEIKEAQHALKILKSHVEKVNIETLSDQSTRINISIKKMGKLSNKYPRPYAQIKKKPL